MRALVIVLAVVSVLYLSVALYFYNRRHRLLYGRGGVASTAALASMRPEERPLPIAVDRLDCWLFRAPADIRTPFVMILCPGRYASKADYLTWVRAMQPCKFTLLLFDYRAETLDERALLQDAWKVYQYAFQSLAGRDARRLMVYGHSMGGVAACLLTQYAQTRYSRGLSMAPLCTFLDSTFSSFSSVLRATRPYLYYPFSYILHPEEGEIAERVRHIRGAVRLLHCADDTTVPAQESRRIAEAADVRLVEYPTGGHFGCFSPARAHQTREVILEAIATAIHARPVDARLLPGPSHRAPPELWAIRPPRPHPPPPPQPT